MSELISIITIVLNFLFAGGLIGWVTLKEKKRQEQEETKQKEEETKQSRIDTERKEFDLLRSRVEFAEGHIVELHKKMTGMQNMINNLVSRTLYAETHICLNADCSKREPALGTFCKKNNKAKKDEILHD